MAKKKDMKKFIRDCALAHAKTHKIKAALKKGLKDKEIVEAIDKFMKKYGKEFESDKEVNPEENLPFVCEPGCGSILHHEDVTCWFCGDDCSEDGESGGWKADEEESEDEGEDEAAESEAETETEDEEEGEEEVDGEDGDEEAADEFESDTPLAERAERILTLARRGGADAWEIGKELDTIVENDLYKESYKTFEQFLAKELDKMNRVTAYNYIRVAKKFSKEHAEQLPIHKLVLLAKITDDKKRLATVKKALPTAKGKGMDIKDLKEAVANARDASTDRSPGRTAVPFKKFLGQTVKGKWDGDEMIIVDVDVLGPGIGLEVKKLKTGLKIEVIELDLGEEEEE